jgi:predicted TIM-barrel fold metal-dependent hydrolase
MDEAGVDRAILVPPSWEGDRNDVVLQAVQDFPERFRAMGRVNLEAPSSIDFTHWMDAPGMLGIRLMLVGSFIGLNDWFWPAVSNAGIPVMVAAPGQNAEVGAVARTFPDARLIIDHMGLGFATREEVDPLIDDLVEVADSPNVAVKISAFPKIMKEEPPFPTLPPILKRVVAAFGADRCMWGSDLTGMTCPYIDWVRAITDAEYLSEGEKELIMNGSISRWLNWP